MIHWNDFVSICLLDSAPRRVAHDDARGSGTARGHRSARRRDPPAAVATQPDRSLRMAPGALRKRLPPARVRRRDVHRHRPGSLRAGLHQSGQGVRERTRLGPLHRALLQPRTDAARLRRAPAPPADHAARVRRRGAAPLPRADGPPHQEDPLGMGRGGEAPPAADVQGPDPRARPRGLRGGRARRHREGADQQGVHRSGPGRHLDRPPGAARAASAPGRVVSLRARSWRSSSTAPCRRSGETVETTCSRSSARPRTTMATSSPTPTSSTT